MEKILNEIKDRLSIFKDFYTYIRIVEPIKKKAYIEQDNNAGLKLQEGHCYDFWEINSQCSNCISVRAYNENQTIVKIEMDRDKLYLIQALPTNISGQTVIVEILKDITNTAEITSTISKEGFNLQGIITTINTKLIIDELTGIYNRRFVAERLPSDLYEANLRGGSVSLVMADIDRFKDVNDNYGHDVGDCVLREFSTLIKSSIREDIDWIARYGGEEFLIMLRNIDQEKTKLIIDKMREKVENHIFCQDSLSLKITCSFGVAVAKEDFIDTEKIIKSADDRLLEAKRTGRNKVVLGKQI